MKQEQLEEMLGSPLYDFIDEGGKPCKGGFIQIPRDYHHYEIEDCLDQLAVETKIRFKPGTQSQAIRLEDAVNGTALVLPKNWCVPIPEDDVVLFYDCRNLAYLNVGVDGVHWKSFYKIFICFPVTDPIPCYS